MKDGKNYQFRNMTMEDKKIMAGQEPFYVKHA